jgi:hypothetical protein
MSGLLRTNRRAPTSHRANVGVPHFRGPLRQSPTPEDGLVFERFAWRRSSPAPERLPPERQSWSIEARRTIQQNSTHGHRPPARGYFPDRQRQRRPPQSPRPKLRLETEDAGSTALPQPRSSMRRQITPTNWILRILKMVGGPGFEPGASRSRNLGGLVHRD